MSLTAPYICQAHMQKLKMLEAHATFDRAQNVINAILFLEKLRSRASLKAFPRQPVKLALLHSSVGSAHIFASDNTSIASARMVSLEAYKQGIKLDGAGGVLSASAYLSFCLRLPRLLQM